jgi:phospholipid/cholesterol/gamma-HCH transport system substrate-binding protein
VAVVALALVLASGGPSARTVRAAFAGAINVVPGQEVRIAGVKVGEVHSVREADGQALLDLQIDDSRAWPLHQGTVARLRYGTTVSYASRYVELFPGPRSAPALQNGGVLTSADTITPVEFDQIFNIYDGQARSNLRGLIANGAGALQGESGELGSALQNSPGAFDQLAGMMRELGADRNLLDRLVTQGARATAALERVDGPLRALIDNLAGSFDELANHAAAQQASLDRMPRTFATARDTLHRFDESLNGLDGLVTDIAPGASGLVRLAGPAAAALSELQRVAPLGTRTLSTGTRAGPAITALLREGSSFLPNFGTVLHQLTPAMGCLRPYGPELTGALSTWAGFAKNYDSIAHYARTLVQTLAYPAGVDSSSQQLVGMAPGTTYAFPRPPGLNAGQTWLQSQCDAGPTALLPGADPEAKR